VAVAVGHLERALLARDARQQVELQQAETQ
jgi:hypothetical protein